MAVWTKFIQDWSNVTIATSKEDFFRGCGEFKKDWLQFPNVVDYLARTWFYHREAFIHEWTNQVKHCGKRMTNRAEGSYGKLKMHLELGEGSFTVSFLGIANMLCLQLNEVQSNLERSFGSIKETYHKMPFKE